MRHRYGSDALAPSFSLQRARLVVLRLGGCSGVLVSRRNVMARPPDVDVFGTIDKGDSASCKSSVVRYPHSRGVWTKPMTGECLAR